MLYSKVYTYFIKIVYFVQDYYDINNDICEDLYNYWKCYWSI